MCEGRNAHFLKILHLSIPSYSLLHSNGCYYIWIMLLKGFNLSLRLFVYIRFDFTVLSLFPIHYISSEERTIDLYTFTWIYQGTCSSQLLHVSDDEY